MDENKTAAVQQEKASPKLMVGYGLGEIGCQMSWYMINNLHVHSNNARASRLLS